MPLTTERPGVFRGCAQNHWDWFVVDPAQSNPEDIARRWKDTFAPTNEPSKHRQRRVTRGWLVFAVLGLASVTLAAFATHGWPQPGAYVVGLTLSFAGLCGAGVVGFRVGAARAAVIVDRAFPVEVVNRRLVKLVDDSVDLDDLWEIAKAYRAVAELRSWWWSDGPIGESSPVPGGYVAPLLLEHFAIQRTRLGVIATKLDVELGKELDSIGGRSEDDQP